MQENNLTPDYTYISPSPDDTRYLVTNRLEIIRILNTLVEQGNLVSAFFHGGNEFLLSAVLHIDAKTNKVYMDYSASNMMNERILFSDKIIFLSSQDGVKIQWTTTAIESCIFEGYNAFRIDLPSDVLRLQRREFYRLPTPVINPIMCSVPLSADFTMHVPVKDVSAGGICLALQDLSYPIELGKEVQGCKFELKDIGLVETALKFQSISEVTLKNGTKSMRVGCEFINMRAGTQSMVQRFIMRLERERISRLL